MKCWTSIDLSAHDLLDTGDSSSGQDFGLAGLVRSSIISRFCGCLEGSAVRSQRPDFRPLNERAV